MKSRGKKLNMASGNCWKWKTNKNNEIRAHRQWIANHFFRPFISRKVPSRIQINKKRKKKNNLYLHWYAWKYKKKKKYSTDELKSIECVTINSWKGTGDLIAWNSWWDPVNSVCAIVMAASKNMLYGFRKTGRLKRVKRLFYCLFTSTKIKS